MDTENLEIEQPVEIETEPLETSEPTKRKYTRKAPKLEEHKIDSGSATKKTSRAKKSSPAYDEEAKGKLAKNLQGLHIMGAMLLQFPELALGDQEAEMLADGIVKVSNEYGLELSGKTGAAIQLLGACAMIYWPRLIALKKRQAQAPVTVDHAQG